MKHDSVSRIVQQTIILIYHIVVNNATITRFAAKDTKKLPVNYHFKEVEKMEYGKKLQVIFIAATCGGTALAAAAGVTMPLGIAIGMTVGVVVIVLKARAERIAPEKKEGERT